MNSEKEKPDLLKRLRQQAYDKAASGLDNELYLEAADALSELKADARRYRWLRGQWGNICTAWRVVRNGVEVNEIEEVRLYLDDDPPHPEAEQASLDKAIDAILAGSANE